jgi:hypothetical protein
LRRKFITTAIGCVLLGTPPSLAQDVPPPDPLGTRYSAGAEDVDPEALKSVPVAAPHRAFLPVSIDLKKFMPAPGRQAGLGACVAWAVGYAARTYYGALLEARDPQDSRNQPSPNYVFMLANKRAECTGGTNIVDVTDVLKSGALSLAAYPYSPECKRPSQQLVAQASEFRVKGFKKVDFGRLDNVKGVLARAHPVIIGFLAGPTFDDFRGEAAFTDTTTAKPGTPQWGMHAMTLVGYDDRRQAFQLINSWGRGWGDGGYAWISYDAFKALVRWAYVLDVDIPRRPVAFSPPRQPAPGGAVAVASPELPPAQPPVEVAVRPPPRPRPAQVDPAPVRPAPRPAQVTPPTVAPQLSELRNLACADVTVTTAGGRTILNGYVATDDDLAAVRRTAAAVPNTALGNVYVAPWPQCEALQTLARPLAAADRPDVVIGPKLAFRSGETLTIEVRSPQQIRYIYVAYVQADGTVVNLAQPRGVVPQPTLPGQTLIFGDGQAGRQTFTVTPPFGREMIIALASGSPLFDTTLAAQLTDRDYLSELRRALIYKASPDLPDREVAASVVLLQTYE